jgi:outer membrane cobalamin receptor
VERNAVRSGIPLENEKQLSMDVGLEMTLNPRHQLRCSLFNYRRDNALVDDGYFVINGVDTRAYLNADLRQAGLELQHDWQISNNWSLQSNYSRMNRNSEQTATNLGFISGVSDQPKYFWNSALHWQGRRFSTIINHHYMSGYQNSELLPGNKTVLYAMGDFHTTDVTVNYRLPNKKNRQEYLQVHIQNLEDKHYHTMNGHHNPDFGRRILFSYRLNY